MKPTTGLAALAIALSAALPLAACSSDDGPVVATDPSQSQEPTEPPEPGAPTVPTEVSAAAGEVRTRGLIIVMDTGGGPEVCLGPIAESYPPQCGGPALEGWDWEKQGAGMFEKQGRTRWGSYALTGTWDGTAMTATSAAPGTLYDPAPVEPTTPPPAEVDLTPAELEEIAAEVADLPGSSGSGYVDGNQVLVDVTYDDGSLQDYVDETYGVNVVIVSGQLVDAT